MITDILRLIKKYAVDEHMSLVNKEMWYIKKTNTQMIIIDRKIWERTFYHIDRKWFLLLLADIVEIKNLSVKGDLDIIKMVLDVLYIQMSPEEKLDNLILDIDCAKKTDISRYKTLATYINLHYSIKEENLGNFLENCIIPIDNIKIGKITLDRCRLQSTIVTFNRIIRNFLNSEITVKNLEIQYIPKIKNRTNMARWKISNYTYQFSAKPVPGAVDAMKRRNESVVPYGDRVSKTLGCINFTPMNLAQIIAITHLTIFKNTLLAHRKINLIYELENASILEIPLQIHALLIILWNKLLDLRNITHEYDYKIISIDFRENKYAVYKQIEANGYYAEERIAVLKKQIETDQLCREVMTKFTRVLNGICVDLKFLL